MGNKQTALSGIHPFKDENEQSGLPAPPLIQFPTFPSALEELTQQGDSHHPQQVTIGPASPRWIEATQGNKFDELFVMKVPTPPPRRPSEPLRGALRGGRQQQEMKGGFSLRNLPKMIGRPDLNKLGTLLRRWKKRKTGDVYPVPPDAEKPSPPSRPEVFLEQDEFFLLRWDPPAYDGGLPIIGYIIQHLELGLPTVEPVEKDDTQSWYSSEPGQVTSTEVLLNNLIEGTTYRFRIIAENLLGYSQPGELSEPMVFNPRGILNDYFCPPVLIIPLADTYNAIEHERVVLSIEITGQPYPIVKWYDRNEVEVGGLGSDPRFIVTSCGQKRILTIAGVECQDSGGIRVVGENEKGIVECKATLIVEAPPHIRRVQRLDLMKSEDPQELASDDQKFLKRRDSRNDEELIFQSGELGRFKFLWSASPFPNICVYHEGDLVDGEETGGDRGRVTSDRVVAEVSDNLITVKLNGIQRQDRGEWMVRLDNVLGEDSAIVLVTVTDRPSRTGKPDVLQLSDNTVILKWDKPNDDGGCPVQGYIVEYFRSEWGVWLKACTTKNPYTKIRDLIPGSKYKFRVKAENLYGVSEPSEESVELLITDLASTLRSVSGDGEGASMLMKTVEEEEEEDAVRIEEEEPGTGRSSKPSVSPRRRFDRGSSASLMRVSTSTMTELSGLKGKSGPPADSVEPATIQRSTSSPIRLQPQPTVPLRRSPSPSTSKFLSVSFQPQVIVLPDDDEELMGDDVLMPPELAPRKISPEMRRRSPSPMQTIMERSPSPLPPKPLTRTVVQQLNLYEQEEPQQMNVGEIRKSPSRSPAIEEEEEVLGPAPIPPRRHVQPQHLQPQQHQQQQRQPSPTPPSHRHHQAPQPPMQIQPMNEQPKKLYSRAEIIKSAATNELDYYYLGLSDSTGAEAAGEEHHEEEHEEEDPELLKVKEALLNDTLFDDLEDEEDEEEYEYDFDKLKEEYEEDKKKGLVSRQDSGVSGRSVEKSESIEVEEEPSYGEDMEEDERGRAASVQSERVGMRSIAGSFREPFERAQSEVVGPRQAMGMDDDFMDRRRPQRAPQTGPPPGGSRTFLTDRFTDYIAMKASSRNKAVGSSLRSLSSRYSSSENVEGRRGSVSRDSGRSSMVVPETVTGGSVVGGGGGGAPGSGEENKQSADEEREGEDNNTVINRVSLLERPFTFREFRAEEEMKGVKGLEGSRPGWGSKRSVSSLPYDLVHPVQTGGSSRRVLGAGIDDPSEQEGGGRDPEEVEREEEEARTKRRKAPPVPVVPNRFISNPDIFLMRSGDGGRRRGELEHSKSETNFDTWIPDSVLKMRAGSFINRGGCGGEDTTEEDYSYGADEFGDEVGGSGSAEIGLERDCPADRQETEGEARVRRTVSFGDTEEEFSYEEEYEKLEDDEKDEGDDQREEQALGEAPRLEEIEEEEGGHEFMEEEEEEQQLEEGEGENEWLLEEGGQQWEDEEKGEENLEEGEHSWEGEAGQGMEMLEVLYHPKDDDEGMDEEIERMKSEMMMLEAELGLAERDFGEMPQMQNVWVEEEILEEYSEGDDEPREQTGEIMEGELEGNGKAEGVEDEEGEEQPVEETEDLVQFPVDDLSIEKETENIGQIGYEVLLNEPKEEEKGEMSEQPPEKSEETVEEMGIEDFEQTNLEVASAASEETILEKSEEPVLGNLEQPGLEQSYKSDLDEPEKTTPEKMVQDNMESDTVEQENIMEDTIRNEQPVQESVAGEEKLEADICPSEEIAMKLEDGAKNKVLEESIPVEPSERFATGPATEIREDTEVEIVSQLDCSDNSTGPGVTEKADEANVEEINVAVQLVTEISEGVILEENVPEDEPGQSEIPQEEVIYLEAELKPESSSSLEDESQLPEAKTDDVPEGHSETSEVVMEKAEELETAEELPEKSSDDDKETCELPEDVEKFERNVEELEEILSKVELSSTEEEKEAKELVTETLPDSTEPNVSDLLQPCDDDELMAQEPVCDIPEPEQDKMDAIITPKPIIMEDNKKTVEEIPPTPLELQKNVEPTFEEEIPSEYIETVIDSLEKPPEHMKAEEPNRPERVVEAVDSFQPTVGQGRTIDTSVELQDTLIVEDVVVGKVDLEMPLERITEMNARLHPEVKENPPRSTSPTRASPIEEEIDKELLSIHMSIPSDFHHHTPHHHHVGEPRRTISIDRLTSLTPVEEESPAGSRSIIPQRRPPPSSFSSASSYRPNMSIYDKIMSSKSPSSSLSSSRISISSRSSSTATITTPRPTSPFRIEEDASSPLDINEIRYTILQSSPREFLESFSISSSPRGTPPPSSSRPSTPISGSSLAHHHPHQLSRTDEDYPDEISPFMNYLFHGAFYLMLSPMLLFVDSLYLALACLFVVACVHFFIIKF